MAMKINTNTEANFASRMLGITSKDTDKTLQRIATGLRINQAGDDAAGLAISERLRSLNTGYEQSSANLQDAMSMLQVAEGGMSNVSDSLQRIRELSAQAANDTLTDADRATIQTEVDQLVEEIDRQTGATQFNGKDLLTGDYATNGAVMQVGPNEGDTLEVEIAGTSAATLGVAGLDVSTREAAANALSTLDTAINRVSSERGTVGSVMNRVANATEYVGIARENTLAAMSQLRDADMAGEATRLAINQIKNQSGLAALSQANMKPQAVLQLLGG